MFGKADATETGVGVTAGCVLDSKGSDVEDLAVDETSPLPLPSKPEPVGSPNKEEDTICEDAGDSTTVETREEGIGVIEKTDGIVGSGGRSRNDVEVTTDESKVDAVSP